MIKRGIPIIILVAAVLVAGLFVVGNSSGAGAVWPQYQAALARNDFEGAARLVSREQRAEEDRIRHLALTGTQTELARLSTADLVAVVGVRQAVHGGALPPVRIRKPQDAFAFHAEMRRVLPQKPLQDFALLQVLPVGTHRAIGWLGPKDYAGSTQTLLLAMAFGMRVDLVHEDGLWRVNYLRLFHAAAREQDAIGATADPNVQFEVRRERLNRMMANMDAERLRAIWAPIDGGR